MFESRNLRGANFASCRGRVDIRTEEDPGGRAEGTPGTRQSPCLSRGLLSDVRCLLSDAKFYVTR